MVARAIDELRTQEWHGLKEFARLLVGKPVRIHVNHREDKYSLDLVARIYRYEKGVPLTDDFDDSPAA